VFDSTSRYSTVATVTIQVTGDDGLPHSIRYVDRRFIPQTSGTTLVEHAVGDGERLDVITARYLSDATQFWRICDANDVVRPEDLTDQPGTVIRIALPGM
jgi:hypothetical protein